MTLTEKWGTIQFITYSKFCFFFHFLRINIYIPLEYGVSFQTAYSTKKSILIFFKNDSSLWVPQEIRVKECSETCREYMFLLGGKVMPGITKLEEEFGLLYLTWW